MRLKITHGMLVETLNTSQALVRYSELRVRRADQSERVSVNTWSWSSHETLYQAPSKRWYIITWSDYQGTTPEARWVTRREAAGWLVHNEHELPKELAHYVDSQGELLPTVELSPRLAYSTNYKDVICERHWGVYDEYYYRTDGLMPRADCGAQVDKRTIGEPEAHEHCYFCGSYPSKVTGS